TGPAPGARRVVLARGGSGGRQPARVVGRCQLPHRGAGNPAALLVRAVGTATAGAICHSGARPTLAARSGWPSHGAGRGYSICGVRVPDGVERLPEFSLLLVTPYVCGPRCAALASRDQHRLDAAE